MGIEGGILWLYLALSGLVSQSRGDRTQANERVKKSDSGLLSTMEVIENQAR